MSYILHFYPGYHKKDIKHLTYSEVSTLVDMIIYIKDPKQLQKLKSPPVYKTVEEFEQAILRGRGK